MTFNLIDCIYIQTDGIILRSSVVNVRSKSVEEVPRVFTDLFRFRFADCLIAFLRSLVARFLYFFLVLKSCFWI